MVLRLALPVHGSRRRIRCPDGLYAVRPAEQIGATGLWDGKVATAG